MKILPVISRVLLLAAWSGAVAATTVWAMAYSRSGSFATIQGSVSGKLVKTGRPLDLAIVGEGYFVVADPLIPGGLLYTRQGRLTQDAQGQLVIVNDDYARSIEPSIIIPQSATQIHFGRDGVVSYLETEGTTSVQAGIIQLARFDSRQQLRPYEDETAFLLPTDSSSPTVCATPGISGLGTIRQHKLEATVLEHIAANESQESNH